MRMPEQQPYPHQYNLSEYIVMPPVFDIPRLQQARQDAELLVGERTSYDLPATVIGTTLTLYNQQISYGDLYNPFQISERNKQIKQKLENIIAYEVLRSNPLNPLPPIGFEVEAPLAPYIIQTNPQYLPYQTFSDILQLPDNVASTDPRIDNPKAIWEFSPPPAYTADTAVWILSELIKGRFIPSLNEQKTNNLDRNAELPEKIRQHLSERLISLHINLGVPDGISTAINDSPFNDDMNLVAKGFTAGYTSSLRLKHRKMKNHTGATIKSGSTTGKQRDGKPQRVEIKSFEVKSEETYRLFYELQRISAAIIASHAAIDHYQISEYWQKVKSEIEEILPGNFTSLLRTQVPEEKLADMRERLRPVFTYYAHQIDTKLRS